MTFTAGRIAVITGRLGPRCARWRVLARPAWASQRLTSTAAAQRRGHTPSSRAVTSRADIGDWPPRRRGPSLNRALADVTLRKRRRAVRRDKSPSTTGSGCATSTCSERCGGPRVPAPDPLPPRLASHRADGLGVCRAAGSPRRTRRAKALRDGLRVDAREAWPAKARCHDPVPGGMINATSRAAGRQSPRRNGSDAEDPDAMLAHRPWPKATSCCPTRSQPP